MYSLRLSKTAEKQIKKLDKSINDKVVKKLGQLLERPHPRGSMLTGELAGLRRVYCGKDYRIIYAIDDVSKQIEIVRVAHRSKVYLKTDLSSDLL